ncbi:hypothetical protein PHJA_001761000 [Phtheirospermum japonicum]|uniref:RRM domain-containing protein n=1 Tax=Phtheirospermum japonicum TaxID=374723 RepID=A0A830CA75_9LAMI|nr:hypothetical protein PHJA_001761000 [Phtheirospermum japonicum]
MQSLGKFPSQAHYNTLLLHKPVLQFPSKPHFLFSTRLNFNTVLGKLRNGLYCNALKPKKKGELSLSEMDGLDELEDDDDFDDGFLDVDEDEDEIEMPLMNMKKWLENRPRGFGEGKVYDTSVEDKLMEEIEHSKKAQLANVNKLKNNNSPVEVKIGSKKEINKQDKGSTLVEDGFRVRLLNLPKKKNIHKDLRLAFEGVRGILNIVPVVSGNEKTRDPVCKGIAFVDFKLQDDARSFVQNFSGKSIAFGKVVKQIKCEMVNPKKTSPARDESDGENNFTPKQAVVKSDVNKITTGVQTDVPLLESREESVPSVFDNAGEDDDDDDDDKIKKGTSTTTSESDSSKQRRKLKTNEKKVASKQKKDKIPKLNIPGSANRLKIREKEMLTGVFSKYGATVKEHSR